MIRASELCHVFRQIQPDGLGNSKVDDLRHRGVCARGHQYIRRLQIPVDHAFLMGVQYSLADQYEEFYALANREPVPVAVV